MARRSTHEVAIAGVAVTQDIETYGIRVEPTEMVLEVNGQRHYLDSHNLVYDASGGYLTESRLNRARWQRVDLFVPVASIAAAGAPPSESPVLSRLKVGRAGRAENAPLAFDVP
jgi:hypothetical protein